jgi:hypothetical protein
VEGKLNQPNFRCFCKLPKKHRLIFDGGSSGQYTIDLCKRCYRQQDKRFLIFEERIGTDTAAIGSGGGN